MNMSVLALVTVHKMADIVVRIGSRYDQRLRHFHTRLEPNKPSEINET